MKPAYQPPMNKKVTLEEVDRYAAFAHYGQYRKTGEPYVEHPRRVAALVDQHFHLLGDPPPVSLQILKSAALLHDTIEDCGVLPRSLGDFFGSAVQYLVENVTKYKYDRNRIPARAIRSLREFHRLGRPKELAQVVAFLKAMDRIDNLRSCRSPGLHEFAAQYTVESYGLLYHLIPHLPEELASILQGEIRKTHDWVLAVYDELELNYQSQTPVERVAPEERCSGA